MIEVKRLTKSFNGQKILDDISFQVQDAQIVALLGESGTGKSVLLKHLMGLIQPDSGEIWIDGVDVTKSSEKDLLKIRRKIGFLFQEGALYDFMNVYDNIAFPLREHTRFSEKEIRRKVISILELIDLKGIEEKMPSELSGGMKKRVGLARAVILDSKKIFCDEPTSGLDPIRSRDISDLIASVSQRLGCTTIITSHDIVNARRVADRLIMLKDGKIIYDGDKEAIRQSGNPFVQEFMR